MLHFQKADAQQHDEAMSKAEIKERKKHIKSLNKLINKYRIDKLRDSIHEDIEETKEHIDYTLEAPRQLTEDILQFAEEIQIEHEETLKEG
jgi:Na+/phosphate symporter